MDKTETVIDELAAILARGLVACVPSEIKTVSGEEGLDRAGEQSLHDPDVNNQVEAAE